MPFVIPASPYGLPLDHSGFEDRPMKHPLTHGRRHNRRPAPASARIQRVSRLRPQARSTYNYDRQPLLRGYPSSTSCVTAFAPAFESGLGAELPGRMIAGQRSPTERSALEVGGGVNARRLRQPRRHRHNGARERILNNSTRRVRRAASDHARPGCSRSRRSTSDAAARRGRGSVPTVESTTSRSCAPAPGGGDRCVRDQLARRRCRGSQQRARQVQRLGGA